MKGLCLNLKFEFNIWFPFVKHLEVGFLAWKIPFGILASRDFWKCSKMIGLREDLIGEISIDLKYNNSRPSQL